MTPIVAVAGPLATADPDNICTSQTPSGAGALTLVGDLVSGGVATMDNPRRVLITTGADESSNTFTIHGTNWAGDVISEVMTGPNHTTGYSVLDYKTVTSIVISGAAGAALTVGTNGVGGSPWVRLDSWANSYVAIQCTASGTVNYTLQSTLDDPNSATNPVSPASITWINSNDSSAVGATGTIQTNFGFAPVWTRIVLNSGTGTVTTTFSQSDVVSR